MSVTLTVSTTKNTSYPDFLLNTESSKENVSLSFEIAQVTIKSDSECDVVFSVSADGASSSGVYNGSYSYQSMSTLQDDVFKQLESSLSSS